MQSIIYFTDIRHFIFYIKNLFLDWFKTPGTLKFRNQIGKLYLISKSLKDY